MRIVKCEALKMLVYEEDAIKTNTGYISTFGMWNSLTARYDALEERKVVNVFCYLLPGLLFALWCVLTEVLDAVNPTGEAAFIIFTIICSILQYGAIGLGIFASIRWLKAKDMIQDIGNPEALLIESKGTIDLDTGHVSVSTTSEDVYSDRQIIDIIMNIIKFIIVFAAIFALGWLYWIIYMVRKSATKKRIKQLDEQIAHGESADYTLTAVNIMMVNDKALDKKMQVVKDSDGEYVNFTFSFLDTFIHDGIIYAIFQKEEDKYLVVKVLPGYNSKAVEMDSEFKEVMDAYSAELANQD